MSECMRSSKPPLLCIIIPKSKKVLKPEGNIQGSVCPFTTCAPDRASGTSSSSLSPETLVTSPGILPERRSYQAPVHYRKHVTRPLSTKKVLLPENRSPNGHGWYSRLDKRRKFAICSTIEQRRRCSLVEVLSEMTSCFFRFMQRYTHFESCGMLPHSHTAFQTTCN